MVMHFYSHAVLLQILVAVSAVPVKLYKIRQDMHLFLKHRAVAVFT